MAYISKYDQVKSNKPKKMHKKTKPKVKTPHPVGEYKCAGCGCTKYLEIHHCFYGDKDTRDFSSINNCVEWLCYHHHRGQPKGVHGGNIELDIQLKKKHQTKLESNGMNREEFVRNVGKNYL